jgi:SPP1 family phage portal protein
MKGGAHMIINDGIRVFTGRKQIFTDEAEVNTGNIYSILDEAMITHNENIIDIKYLKEYVKGVQPILDREKPIRDDINIRVVFNRAAQIVDFKLKYEFGSPITYVRRSKDEADGFGSDVDDRGVSLLNEMMGYSNKPAIDLQIAKNFKTCGVGYRLIEPSDDPLSIIKMASLNPESSFVVYRNDAYRKPILGVTYFKKRNGDTEFTCYSADTIYIVTSKFGRGYTGEPIVYPNIPGQIPIIEYVNNYDRMSDFERVISLINALNVTNSDRMNDIAQHVQSIIWMNNCEPDDDQEIKSNGVIITKSQQGVQANIQFLENVLNQSEIQTLVDHVNDQIDVIANVPGRQETGGGSTGSAMNLSNGWQAAETAAKGMELIFSESERRTLDVVSGIINNTENVPDELVALKISDIEPKFSRNKTYDLATKCSSLVALLNAGVDGLTAFTVVGLFTDPQLAWENSKETVEKIRTSGNKVSPNDVNKVVQNTTNQPSKVSNVDEGI